MASDAKPSGLSGRRCFACGGAIEPPLRRAGSPRCLDCRAADAPLDPRLLAEQTRLSAKTYRAGR